MNWGKGIAIALIAFIGFITVLVVILMSNKVDLVSEDYYQREITYESEIESLKNSNELDNNPVLVLNDNHVLVQFNSEVEYSDIKIELKRPDDEKEDKSYKVENTKSFMINRTSLLPGNYDMNIYYTLEGKPCMQKETFYN